MVSAQPKATPHRLDGEAFHSFNQAIERQHERARQLEVVRHDQVFAQRRVSRLPVTFPKLEPPRV